MRREIPSPMAERSLQYSMPWAGMEEENGRFGDSAVSHGLSVC